MNANMHEKILQCTQEMLIDLQVNLPYYGNFLLFMSLHERKDIKTCAVNITSQGMNFYYNTEFLDGKTQISEASQKLESVIQENAQLKSELDSIKANLLVEQKSATLDESQKKYIKKVMAGKSADFINENFDYTVKLFNKKSSDRLDTLKEEALSESTKVDRVVLEQTEEQQPQQLSPYLRELSKY
jgi:regulator of replication initiation timing